MPARKRLKIATFNVNGVLTRLPHLLTWLAREQPDIVALQELKATQEAFPEAAIREAGYGCIWQGQRSWNGSHCLRAARTRSKAAAGCPATRKTTRAAIWKRPRMA